MADDQSSIESSLHTPLCPITEEWRAVVEWEGSYEVSNRGRIRRLAAGQGARAGHILRLSGSRTGYYRIRLYRDGCGTSYNIHDLVYRSFIAPDSRDGHAKEIDHIDGHKSHNCVNNLELVPNGENKVRAYRLGLMRDGEGHPLAKLSTQQVSEIRARYIPGVYGYHRLGKEYGVRHTTIIKIMKGQRRNHG